MFTCSTIKCPLIPIIKELHSCSAQSTLHATYSCILALWSSLAPSTEPFPSRNAEPSHRLSTWYRKKSFLLATINWMLQGLHFLFRNAPLPCPFEDTMPVLAGMFMRKVGTWHWHILRPFQRKQRNISMAQDCLSKYIDTVILLWSADGTTQVGGKIPVCNRLSRLSSSVAFA